MAKVKSMLSSNAPWLMSDESSKLADLEIYDESPRLNTDLNLADMLSDIGEINFSLSDSKLVNSNGDSHLYSFHENSYNRKIAPANNIFDEDLTILLDSSEVHSSQSSCPVSLDDLAINHFINNSQTNLEKSSSPECCGSFAPQSKIEDMNAEQSLLDILKIDSPVNKPVSITKKEKITSESSEDEIVPDIDLSFCVKKGKNSKDNTLISKSVDSNGDSNLYSFHKNSYHRKMAPANNIFDEDLTILLDSSEVHSSQSSCSVSLDDLAINHFINNSQTNLEKSSSPEGCRSFAPQSKIEDMNAEQSLLDILKIDSPVNKPVSITKKEKITSESSEDEIVPDIDLSFCVKKRKNKNSKDNTLISSSPESFDSGFNQATFSSLESSFSFQDFLSNESVYPLEKSLTSVLTKPKQSLLSIAISCKPKFDKIKREKVKNIKKDLLKKYFPIACIESTLQIKLDVYKNIEDQSNKCVVVGNCRQSVQNESGLAAQ